MSRLVSLLLSFALLFAPLLAYADDGAAPAPEPEPELAAPARVDDLGRPFPDPLLLRRSRTWTGLGAGMTGLGSAMVVTGLFVGSAFARGEIVPPRLELAGPLVTGWGTTPARSSPSSSCSAAACCSTSSGCPCSPPACS